MTQFSQINEETYRQEKQKNLEKTLGNLYSNPDWIWIGGNSRRKITFQIDGKNRVGFFAEKSKTLIEINEDPLAEKEISDLIPALKNLLKTQEQNLYTQIIATLFDNGLDLVFVANRALNFSQTQKLLEFGKTKNLNISYRLKNEITPIFLIRKNQIFYPDFKINLDSDIFIQATKSGLASIIKVIRTSFEKEGGAQSASEDFYNEHSEQMSIKSPVASRHPLFQRGLKVADIYAGFGAYTFAIQDLVKSIFAFEGDQKMIDLLNKNVAANNLGNKIKAETRDLFLDPLSAKELKNFDLAIINPPRTGAAPQITQISKSQLKKVIYVSCNPTSFKHDAEILIDSGFKITKLIALDQFYSTKHLELISIFQK